MVVNVSGCSCTHNVMHAFLNWYQPEIIYWKGPLKIICIILGITTMIAIIYYYCSVPGHLYVDSTHNNVNLVHFFLYPGHLHGVLDALHLCSYPTPTCLGYILISGLLYTVASTMHRMTSYCQHVSDPDFSLEHLVGCVRDSSMQLKRQS